MITTVTNDDDLHSLTTKNGDTILFKSGQSFDISKIIDVKENNITIGTTGAEPATLTGNGRWGTHILQLQGRRIKIDNLHLTNNKNHSLLKFLPGCLDVIVSDCEMSYTTSPKDSGATTGTGPAIHGSGWMRNIVITNCSIHDISGEGIYFGNYKDTTRQNPTEITIKNSAIYKCGEDGIDFKEGVANSVIQKCTIWQTSLNGPGRNGIIVGGQGNKIVGNFISDISGDSGKSYGIRISQTDLGNAAIIENTIKSITGKYGIGIRINQPNFGYYLLKNNYVFDTQTKAFFNTSDDVVLDIRGGNVGNVKII